MSVGTQLIVVGPFRLKFERSPKGTSKQITLAKAAAFWGDSGPKSVAEKQGCYVFALKVSNGYTPWYVGKATKNFAQEATHLHKLQHYNEVIYKDNKGTPVLFFVTRPGTLKKIPKKQIDELETYLIQSAAQKNPALKNKQKIKGPDWGIRGVVRGGQGKPSPEARAFTKMMRL